MTDLKEVLSREIDASGRHVPMPPLPRVLHGARARRRRRSAAAAGLGVAAVIVVVGAAPRILGHESTSSPDRGQHIAPAASASSSPTTTDERMGALALAGTYGCLGVYSPEAIASTAIAFDGTVEQIEPSSGAKAEMRSDVQTVTFVVNRAYRGGAARGDSVRLTMFQPDLTASIPSYDVGSRLLVSASASRASGGVVGSVLPCGFTRYYDEDTASAWEAATR